MNDLENVVVRIMLLDSLSSVESLESNVEQVRGRVFWLRRQQKPLPFLLSLLGCHGKHVDKELVLRREGGGGGGGGIRKGREEEGERERGI